MVNTSYLYNPELSKTYFEKNYFQHKELGFQTIENGMILPHRWHVEGYPSKNWGYCGIVNDKGEYITSSFINNSGAGGIYTPLKNQLNIVTKL